MQETTEFSFKLAPSSLGGVGVFAIHDIDAGVRLAVWPEDYRSRLMHEEDIPAEWKVYCVATENDMWKCPANFNRMEVSWFLNHSDAPNATKKDDQFYSLSSIKAGQEILIDYNKLGEPEHKKEAFYKK